MASGPHLQWFCNAWHLDPGPCYCHGLECCSSLSMPSWIVVILQLFGIEIIPSMKKPSPVPRIQAVCLHELPQHCVPFPPEKWLILVTWGLVSPLCPLQTVSSMRAETCLPWLLISLAPNTQCLGHTRGWMSINVCLMLEEWNHLCLPWLC